MKSKILISLLIWHIKCEVNKNITDLLKTRIEKYANELLTFMETSWQNVCSNDCSCSYHSCSYPLPLYCHSRWSIEGCELCGSLVNETISTLVIGNRFYKVNPEEDSLKEILCAGQGLDKLWKKDFEEETMLIWAYFGSYNGILRSYPASSQCITYDNRYRPWYVAASTGIKDILLIIDTSTNMTEEGLETMKKVVKFILSTLTFNDYAGIVTIGNEGKLFSPYLLRSDQAGVGYMSNFLNSLKIANSSNYETAFNKAYEILDRSVDSDRTSKCQSVIILISGGSPTEGMTNHNELLELIDQYDTGSFYFTYSIGENKDPFLQKLACHKNGINEDIDIKDFYPSMLSYFQTLGTFINASKIAYSEPYVDAMGAGYMTTASIQVYDKTVDPPFIIGVLGFDILMKDLLNIGRIDEIYIAFQEIGSASCSKSILTPCQVESLRPSQYKCGISDNSCTPYKRSMRKCSKTLIEKTLCLYDIREKSRNCCDVNICSNIAVIAISLVLAALLIFGLINFILYYFFRVIFDKCYCRKTKSQEENKNQYIQNRVNEPKDDSSVRIDNKINYELEGSILNKPLERGKTIKK